jgi:sulfate/thiosulfate transport system ATP-binding protein
MRTRSPPRAVIELSNGDSGMSVALQIENAARQFAGFTALKGVSLDIAPGELVALLGPSGSGKTTLLRLIAGLDFLDGGRITFDGVDANALSLRDRRIGMVFQSYALFKHMTVADNVAFGLKARPRGERPAAAAIDRRVKDLLDLVQLGGLERRFPSQLSGGQRQRVALARALAIEPQVLLLDEPFGALDAKVRKDLRAWLRDLHGRTGHTTVFVTHDQEEALELADRVAILNHGKLEQIGAPDSVYDYPATPFVCSFLGETNCLPVDVHGGQAWLDERPIYAAQTTNISGRADLYVRPQHLRLDRADTSPLSGVVEFVRRHGAIRRAEVAIRGLAKRLDIDIGGEVTPSPGERVGLRIQKAHLFKAV